MLTFTPPDSGTYTVSLTATDANGLPNTTTSTVNVFDVAPTPAIAGLSSSIAAGDKNRGTSAKTTTVTAVIS